MKLWIEVTISNYITKMQLIICLSLSSHQKTGFYCVQLTASPEGLCSLAGVWSILFGCEIVLLIAVHPLLHLSSEFLVLFLNFHLLCFELFHVVPLPLFFCVLRQQGFFFFF